MDEAEREAMLTLVLTPGFGPTVIARCVEQFGSATATLGASVSELALLERVGNKTAGQLRRSLDQTQTGDALPREHDLRHRHEVRLLTLDDTRYPPLLRHIPDPPPLLWVRGQLHEEDALAVGVVGSRRCTHYGREQAQRFARQCAEAGLCIVSGGAYGIDAAAHHGALSVAGSGGRTIAVLGSGLAKPYPNQNSDLFDRIAGAGTDEEAGSGAGAVISELPMAAPPLAEQFPRRNRIISGLSLGVLVIEAAKRSGALITARLCVEEHGREAMAVPGRVDSRASEGCHRMLQAGWARLVTSAADVLDSLGEAGELLKAEMQRNEGRAGRDGHSGESRAAGASVQGGGAKEQAASGGGGAGRGGGSGGLFEANLTDGQQRIMALLDHPRSLDEITAWTELPVSRVQADLTLLEIRGTVQRNRGLFVRRHADRHKEPRTK